MTDRLRKDAETGKRAVFPGEFCRGHLQLRLSMTSHNVYYVKLNICSWSPEPILASLRLREFETIQLGSRLLVRP